MLFGPGSLRNRCVISVAGVCVPKTQLATYYGLSHMHMSAVWSLSGINDPIKGLVIGGCLLPYTFRASLGGDFRAGHPKVGTPEHAATYQWEGVPIVVIP